jgi:hypothetical protein
MDKEWARALLSEERHRLELLLRSVEADHDRVVPVDEVSEDLVDGAARARPSDACGTRRRPRG